MSVDTKITAHARTDFGKGAARRTRREGNVPVVLYGHGTEPRHFSIDTLEFAAILRHHGANVVLSLDIDGSEQLALTKQIDVNPITREIEHADLLVVRKGEKVTVEIAVTVEGDAAPGTLVMQDASVVEVEAEALHIPEGIVVDVTDKAAGEQVTAADLALPKGVSLVTDAEFLVVNVVEAPTADAMEAGEDEGIAEKIEESQEADKAESEAEAESEAGE